jgi:hypothetical protein
VGGANAEVAADGAAAAAADVGGVGGAADLNGAVRWILLAGAAVGGYNRACPLSLPAPKGCVLPP